MKKDWSAAIGEVGILLLRRGFFGGMVFTEEFVGERTDEGILFALTDGPRRPEEEVQEKADHGEQCNEHDAERHVPEGMCAQQNVAGGEEHEEDDERPTEQKRPLNHPQNRIIRKKQKKRVE